MSNIRLFYKEYLYGIICFVALTIMLITELFIPKGKSSVAMTLPIVSGEYQILFPYEGNEVEFGNGWLEQSDGEEYRWSRKESSFDICLSDQKKIIMTGYIPLGLSVSHVKLYLNNKLLFEKDINSEEQFVLEANIKGKFKNGKRNSFRVVFDSERIPDKSDTDQRIISALFSVIEFK